jgi:two-component system, response regulator FlrC
MPNRLSTLTPASRHRVARYFVGSTVADMERELILQTLETTHGNRSVAAHILGMSVRTMRNKITQYSASGFVVPSAEVGRRLSQPH